MIPPNNEKATGGEKTFSPNRDLMRQHLEFITSGMSDYDDGRVEIAYGNRENIPNQARTFPIADIDAMVEFAAQMNAEGRNVYVTGAILKPSAAPDKRSRDEDFYASSVVWCDLD